MNGIFWIANNRVPPLAVVLCPYGGDGLWNQVLELKNGGIHTLVSLLGKAEASMLDLDQEGQLAEQFGMQFLSFPIPDTHVPPDPAAFDRFVADLAGRLRAGEHIGVHCRGSVGRATVTAACTLIHLGWSPNAALNAIEAARGCPIPDTREQEAWILAYKAKP
jgi:protein-tyrosine phosphatase